MQTQKRSLIAIRTWWQELALLTFFTALTALAARIAIYLPFTPVPITLQVLMVILCGLLLGSKRGALSQLEYLAAGLMGLPVFAGGKAGPAVLLGPTGGYLLSFPLAAFVAGWVEERLELGHKTSAFLASLAAITVIYLGGTAWLVVWLGGSLTRAWTLGVRPFILVDLIKALLAASVVSGGRLFIACLRDWL